MDSASVRAVSTRDRNTAAKSKSRTTHMLSKIPKKRRIKSQKYNKVSLPSLAILLMVDVLFPKGFFR